VPRGARLNKVIERLEAGRPVFCAAVAQNGDWDGLAQLALSDFDMVIVETEHQGFDLPLLRHSLQHLLHRGRIAAKGSVQPDVVPFVRIPPYARERNQWVIKQTLDAGAYGLVLPHLDSVDAAQAAVRSARYPQARGVPDQEPAGERGWWPWAAAHYWGISGDAYYDAADVWPLDPDGELLLMGIVENAQGIRALPDIVREARGIGAIWVGPGDLSVSLGYRGDLEHPEVEAAVQQALRVCKQARVPVGAVAGRKHDALRRLEQGFDIVVLPPSASAELARARAALAQSKKLDS
jgi:4-hydroxy-2-oxoheptanedioate aldolase